MNAEEQQKKGTSDKIRRPEPEKWKQTDNAAEQKQQRRCKTPEEPMRDCNDDYGISGCHRQPQSNEPKHPADTGPVMEKHEATNR